MTNTGRKNEKFYTSLEQGLKYLREMADTEPAMAAAIRLIEVGQRLESEGEFGQPDVAEITDLLLQDRDPRAALEFLARVEERQPKTMLHRAVVGEINARARAGSS